jgi:endonuclease G
MRKLLFFFIAILMGFYPILAQDVFAYPEVKDGEIVIHHPGFTVSYNPEAMMPNWVAYELRSTDLEGDAQRAGRFSPDPSPQLREYNLADHWHYTNSGWVRGHMVPAGDLKYDQDAMNCSFYTTNICPMDMTFNNGIWKRLEEKIRKLAIQYGSVYIVTGPVLGTNKNGKVGQSEILVPDAFFKAILIPYNGSFLAIGFYLDNEPALKGSKLNDFTMTVRTLEEKIDRDLFASLIPAVSREVETTLPLKELGLY